MLSVCVIAYDGETNPATRQRILQFIPHLEAEGFRFRTFFVPYSEGRPSWSRKELFEAAREADVVVVQRVLAGWLLPLLRTAGTPVVFDVDDALHYVRLSQYASALSPRTLREHVVVGYRTIVRGGRFFSSRKRLFDRMTRLATSIIVGNRTLGEYVAGAARRQVVLPTAVDVRRFPVREHADRRPIRIGWIGVASNLQHLNRLAPVFARLAERYGDDIRLVIVSSRELEGLPIRTEFVRWSLESESEATASFDIGIMPLEDDLFSRGKCSFKAIYCMGHGVPVVISPVGMNRELIESGENGFLADSEEDWLDALSMLIDDPELRRAVGERGRRTIEERYAMEQILSALRETLVEASGRQRA